jgi:hypothetical protein
MSTTQRSDDATPEEKRARLRDAVHGGRPAPTSGATSSSGGTDGVDLRQLAREVERVRLEEEQRRLKAEADETEERRHASARGGPCAYCGIDRELPATRTTAQRSASGTRSGSGRCAPSARTTWTRRRAGDDDRTSTCDDQGVGRLPPAQHHHPARR